MADRALLHKTHLGPFKVWLANHGLMYRGPRGDYQVLQVQLGNQWHCLYEKLNAKEHYTVTGPLVRQVRQFIRDYQKEKERARSQAA